MTTDPVEHETLSAEQSLQLRHTQLEILSAVRSLCEAEGLKYFAIAGTALGAVRHRGFIPWDDDLDIAMPRADFDLLVALAPGRLDDRFFLQHHSTDSNFPLPMAKVRRNDSIFLESAVASVDMHQGIFIDIFPIDRKPRSRIMQQGHFAALSLLSRLARSRAGYEMRSSSNRVFVSILRNVSKAFPIRWLTKSQEVVLRLFATGRGPLTIAGGTYGYQREKFDERWLESVENLSFESTTVPVFSAYGAYLRHLYGNYWDLPPAEHRKSPHDVQTVMFPPPRSIDDAL